MQLSDRNIEHPPTSSGNVFLIEDNTELRESMSEALKSVGYRVYSYPDPAEFLKQPRDDAPSVIVTDVRMSNMSGVELQTKLLGEPRRMQFVFISGESSVAQSITAMKQGALEFLIKPFSRESLLAVVAQAIEIDTQNRRDQSQQAEFARRLSGLSPRERQVFGLLVKGYSNAELVNELGVALSTVKEYKSEMMYKLRLRSLSELIVLNNEGSMKPAASRHTSLLS